MKEIAVEDEAAIANIKMAQVNYSLTSMLLCESVKINFEEDQQIQNIRLVAYRRSNSEQFVLDKNLQITDIEFKKEKPKSFFERLSNSIDDMKAFIGSKFDGKIYNDNIN